MRESKRTQIMRSILPGMATVLSITFAATLRVEHACTGAPAPVPAPVPALLYPYTDLVARNAPSPYFAYFSAPRKWSETYCSSPTTQLSCGSGGT